MGVGRGGGVLKEMLGFDPPASRIATTSVLNITTELNKVTLANSGLPQAIRKM